MFPDKIYILGFRFDYSTYSCDSGRPAAKIMYKASLSRTEAGREFEVPGSRNPDFCLAAIDSRAIVFLSGSIIDCGREDLGVCV